MRLSIWEKELIRIECIWHGKKIATAHLKHIKGLFPKRFVKKKKLARANLHGKISRPNTPLKEINEERILFSTFPRVFRFE